MSLATAVTVLLSVVLYENANGSARTLLASLFPLVLLGCVWLGVKVTPARPERLLVVGDGDETIRLVERFRRMPGGPVTVCGVVATESRLVATASGVPLLGTIHDLRYAVNQTQADRVLVVDTEVPWATLTECLDVCSTMHVPLNFAGGGLTRFPTGVKVTTVAGIRLLEVRREKFEGAHDFIKRATDVALAGVLLVALLPLSLVVAIAIKVNSRGPVLFVAHRVGRGGRHFKFFKFRSMVQDADALRATVIPHGSLDGHVFKAPNDSRITAVGRLMRRWSVDELPQLVNVIRGDMSLVGPRPLPARDLDPDGLSARYRTWSVERATIRPGLTGLWQIRGRSKLPFEEMIRLDLLYVRTRSYRLDLQILLETVPVVLSGRGAM